MAVVRPVYYLNGHFNELDNTTLNYYRNRVAWLFRGNPSVILNRVSSGGSLDAIVDTRYTTGVGQTDASNPDTLAELDDIQEVSVDWENVDLDVESTTEPDTTTHTFPLYYDGNHLKEMSIDDVYDTFVAPATSTMTGTGFPMYTINTTGQATAYTNLGKIFTDTLAASADDSAYQGIAIEVDAVQNIYSSTHYYLLRRDQGSATASGAVIPASRALVKYDNGHAVLMSESEMDDLLEDAGRHYWGNKSGSRLRFGWSTNALFANEGNEIGTVINRQLDGTSVRIKRKFGNNDYRAQEVPAGDSTEADTYRLKVRGNV